MAESGTSTGGPAAVADRSTTDASFKPDAATKYASGEQESATLGSDPHQPNAKPNALQKAGGALESATGKIFGDKELQAQGAAHQGKAYQTQGQDLSTENGVHLGGESAYATK